MAKDSKVIGQRIRQRREQLNISQEKLGEMIGVTYQQIQKYERGTNRVSAERLFSIAGNLKMPVSYFFEGTKEFSVTEEREDKNYVSQSNKSLSSQEQELIMCYRALPNKEAKSELLGFLRSLSKNKKILPA